jgi:hypothetical protein
MNQQMATPLMLAEWSRETGFFGKLREGDFDDSGYQRVAQLLEATDVGNAALSREFVAATWYIPIFLTWQRERCVDRGITGEAYDIAENRLGALVETLLRVP